MNSCVMKMKTVFVCFLACLVCLPGLPAMAAGAKDSPIVRVMGTGDIVDEDTSGAKDQAISNALVAALETVLIEDIPHRIVVANYTAINEMILNKTDSFIKTYRVLAETRLGKKYKVMIEATVSQDKIRSGIVASGIVLDPANTYKILLLVSENNLEDLAPQYWWGKGMSYIKTVSDNTISQVLRKKGFDVLKHRLINPDIMASSMAGTSIGEVLSKEMALSIGKSFGADIIMTGTAIAEQARNTMGEDRSYTGSINLTLYRTDTGERIGAVMQKAVNVNTDEAQGSRDALFEAAKLAGDDVATTINLSMKEEENRPTMIEVVIEGTNFFINYAKLTQKIKTLPGVKRVKQREKQKDTATIIVDFVGNAKSFAKALMAETFEDFGLNISEVTRNHLRLEMIPTSSNIFVR